MRKLLRILCAVSALSAVLINSSAAAVNLEWRPVQQVVAPGDTLSIGLYALASSQENEIISALDVIVGWDTTYLGDMRLGDPQECWLTDGFFVESGGGINSNTQDGLVMYTGWANFGAPVTVSPEGLLCVEFMFTANAPVDRTVVEILPASGTVAKTAVFHGSIPNYDIKGTLGSAQVSVVPEPCSLISLAGAFASVALVYRRKI